MIALAFETSTRASSVALGWLEGTQLQVTAELLVEGAAHARDLLPTALRLLDAQGLAPGDLTDVVVDLGPGSYTGLRVGTATALGLAVGPAAPRLVGVSAPEVLFADALGDDEAGTWLCDGRSKAWYCARGHKSGGQLDLTSGPELVAEGDLADLLSSVGPGERLVCDATSAARLAALHPEWTASRPPADERPIDVAVLLRRGLERLATAGPTAPGDLAPLYLRPFAAKVRKR
ncbi:MAG: tRNA (adenosine(37)-N6)-threonylcarbamoyltransferase complex dimerization subunit type 1 TsaB [Planctomycetota bacterium]|nr:tRNA (adenosine(37)-N6)-threonylcarbamoyltransferase complex dimerization subunit type 1 TsaB [Planctomycetota bacterium]